MNVLLLIGNLLNNADDKAKAKKLGMEIGKDAAEKSKGLFSADDWMCTKYNILKLKPDCAISNVLFISDVEM